MSDVAVDMAPAGTETKADDFSLLNDADFAKEMGLDVADGSPAPASSKRAAKQPDPEPEDEPETEGDSAEAEDPEEEDEPEGETAQKDGTEEGDADETGDTDQAPAQKLATPFTLRQGEDELEYPADLTIEFDRHGKVVSLPLDKIVRLAKDGFHNRDLQVQADRVPVLEEDMQILEERAGKLTETLRRLLTDEEYFLQTQEKFAAAHTPEARAERAERALEGERQEKATLVLRQEFSHFVRDEVQDLVAEALNAAPDVDQDKVMDWVSREIRSFQPTRNAPPPRAAFREIAKVIREEIVPRIADEQARLADKREARDLKEKQAKLTTTVKRAKQLAAGAIRPAGKSGGTPRPKARPIESMEDATEDIIRNLF